MLTLQSSGSIIFSGDNFKLHDKERVLGSNGEEPPDSSGLDTYLSTCYCLLFIWSVKNESGSKRKNKNR